jgi:hypothetical protein
VVVERRRRQQQQQQAPKRLRHLDFVRVAAAQAAVCLAGLYGLAKDHAGPLRPGVDAVESTVRGVAGPVYGRFHAVPLDVLAFVDRKVILLFITPAVGWLGSCLSRSRGIRPHVSSAVAPDPR